MDLSVLQLDDAGVEAEEDTAGVINHPDTASQQAATQPRRGCGRPPNSLNAATTARLNGLHVGLLML